MVLTITMDTASDKGHWMFAMPVTVIAAEWSLLIVVLIVVRQKTSSIITVDSHCKMWHVSHSDAVESLVTSPQAEAPVRRFNGKYPFLTHAVRQTQVA